MSTNAEPDPRGLVIQRFTGNDFSRMNCFNEWSNVSGARCGGSAQRMLMVLRAENPGAAFRVARLDPAPES